MSKTTLSKYVSNTTLPIYLQIDTRGEVYDDTNVRKL